MKNFKKYLLLLLIFFTGCFKTPSNIKDIYSLNEVDEEFSNADQTTLVVFDVDDTLATPTDLVLHFIWRPVGFAPEDQPFIKKVQSEYREYIASKKDPNFDKLIRSKLLVEDISKLIETNSADKIKNLQQRGVKVIALTGLETGPLGIINSLQEWRFKELERLGINFSSSFEQQEIIFSNLKPLSGNTPPMFYKGILLSDHLDKGMVLGAFLDSIKFTPSKVLFFDDGKHNVREVCQEMKNRKINCQGYAYFGATRLDRKINQNIILFQLDYLKKRDDVISSEKAAEQLGNVPPQKPDHAPVEQQY